MLRTDNRSLPFFYASGSVGAGMFSAAPSVLLLYYLVAIVELPPFFASIVIFVPKVWDVITDPLMGIISDHTDSKYGRRHPYMMVGAILTGVLFFLLFSVPSTWSDVAKLTYVCVTYILCSTAYTAFIVPYVTLASEVSNSSRTTRACVAYRMWAALLGIAVASAGAPSLVGLFGGGYTGYSAMAAVLAVIMTSTMLVSVFKTYEFSRSLRPSVKKVESGQSSSIFRNLITQLQIIFSNQDFRWLAICYFVQMCGVASMSAALPFYITSVLIQPEGYVGYAFLAILGGGIMAAPAILRLTSVVGLQALWIASNTVFVSSCLLFMIWSDDLSVLTGIACFLLMGVGFAGGQIVPFMRLAIFLQHRNFSTEDKTVAAFSGVWIALEKMALAMGPLIVGQILALTNVTAIAGEENNGTVVAFSVLPALLVATSSAILLTLKSRNELWSVRS
ncbi:Na+/melibiose symporter [Kordiimonas lacus]|uniref:Na+/melibiose symporter n=1 Tax=Kordiimonas lacus TaxID=637679 RepID=A0A1G7F5R1_9PROT|nr:MFS transporter [Kordiimonas lacus]SDE71086.1 Na+/melibiose symporter [Kordiimonas lacus]